jgi:hypothetical protein
MQNSLSKVLQDLCTPDSMIVFKMKKRSSLQNEFKLFNRIYPKAYLINYYGPV